MMKYLFFFILMLSPVYIWAQSLSIVQSAGWLESAYVTWEPAENADSYNVYYSGEGITDKKIDDQLIRNYGSYYRADVPGLRAGTYTLAVIPVTSGTEGSATLTAPLSVQAHDRTGFAFSNGRVPGAYKADGTVKDNAVVLYITENTKNTVSLEVTGANANPCVGLQTILEGFKKGRDARPLIIRLVGQITDLDYMDKGDIVIENNNFSSSYITLEGVGDDAVADGWGIRVKNATNVEIRNIGSMNSNSDEGDNIGLQQNNEYIWVHNVDFFYGDAGGDADQAKGDGALDCKRSTYVTFSYNHFWDAGKSNLLGLSEGTTEGLFITYHHNWYDHSDSRHPRVRFYSAHVFNNYYDGNSKYGVGSTMGSSVFVEANYFRNCRYPMLTSMQGSDVYNESTQTNDYSNNPTFSKEDGGTIKAFNNFMNGQHRFVPYDGSGYPDPTVDFDAYVAGSRNETISNSIVSAYGANTYNNFDTDASVMYNYTPDSPEAAKEKVMQYAGRINGGDFEWTFNNANDDASYAVNTGLKSALINYQTSLVAIQGEGEPDNGGGDDDDNDDGSGGAEEDMVHNFTLAGTTSAFYSISGNLSDSKGTVTYNELTLTQCLKIESSTLISFTTAREATLRLVFNDNFNGSIKVNGTSHTVSAGTLTLTLPAGTHQISKGDTANLYFMSLAYTGDNSAPTVSDAIADQLYQTGFESTTIDLAAIFADEDNDPLTFTAVSDASAVVSVAVTNHTLTITEVGAGSANITVTADDGNGATVNDTFIIRVNSAPTVANPLTEQLTIAGFGTLTVDLSNTFNDVDDDVLTFSAVSSNSEVVTVSINENTLTIHEVNVGTASITVLANDGNGQEVSNSFDITVNEEHGGEPLGLFDTEKPAMKVYPNPVTEEVMVTWKNEISFSVYNASGIKLKTGITNQWCSLAEFKPGMYFILIHGEHGNVGTRFIKK